MRRQLSINMEKHGISFYEAASVFADRKGILLPDLQHSQDEDRFLLIDVTGNAEAGARAKEEADPCGMTARTARATAKAKANANTVVLRFALG